MIQPVTDDGTHVPLEVFNALCAHSHRMVARVDIIYRGVVVDPRLPVVDGEVVEDRRGVIRRQLNGLQIAAPTKIPTNPDSTLKPKGYMAQVYRGVRVHAKVSTAVWTDYLTTDDGEILATDLNELLVVGDELNNYGLDVPGYDILCPAGLFVLERGRVNDRDLITTVEGSDLMWKVSRALLEEPVAWDPSMTVEQAVADMVEDALGPDVEMDFAGTTHTAPAIVHETGSDPAEVIRQAAMARGYEAAFDPTGRFVWQPEPDLAGDDPVVTISDGPGGILIRCEPNFDANASPNKVVVVSSAVDSPVSASATNNDPLSDTRYDPAGYGKVPIFRSTPHATTQPELQLMANTIFASLAGIARTLEMEVVPNPAITVGDVAHLTSSRLGIDEPVIIDRRSLPLRPERPMRLAVHPPQLIEEGT